MGKLLSKEAILSIDDLQTEDVEVPEWGGTVRVRCMTGTERDAFENSLVSVTGSKRTMNIENYRARLAVKTMIDENGDPLFTDEKDVIALGRKSAVALERVTSVAHRLSGMNTEELEKLRKNSLSAQKDDSTSDLPPSGDAQ